MLWLLFIFIILLESTICVKYEFIGIKPSDGIPDDAPENVGFVKDRLRIKTLENGATLLTILKPNSVPFSIFFKNSDASKGCISTFEMQFGGYPIINVILDCQQNYSQLEIGGVKAQILHSSKEDCSTNVTINSTFAVILKSKQAKPMNANENNLDLNFEQNVENNNSIISLAISAAVENDVTSTCQPFVEFGAEHYLAAFHPAPEIITTTTSTTTTKSPKIISTTKRSEIVVTEASSAAVLWTLIFVFSGTFSAAFGGVGMFFFLRWRQQRLEKKKILLNDDNELNTAKEHTNPPSRRIVAPPSKIPPTITTAKSQLSKV